MCVLPKLLVLRRGSRVAHRPAVIALRRTASRESTHSPIATALARVDRESHRGRVASVLDAEARVEMARRAALRLHAIVLLLLLRVARVVVSRRTLLLLLLLWLRRPWKLLAVRSRLRAQAGEGHAGRRLLMRVVMHEAALLLRPRQRAERLRRRRERRVVCLLLLLGSERRSVNPVPVEGRERCRVRGCALEE